MFYLTMHSCYLRLYGMECSVKDYSNIVRGNHCCYYMGYSFQLAARGLLYAPSHRQDSIYHSLCYSSQVTRNGSVCPSLHYERTLYHGAISHSSVIQREILIIVIIHVKTMTRCSVISRLAV